MKIPGIGLIHAATISAIIETPHRFANKKKVWMYAGIGTHGEEFRRESILKEVNKRV